MQSIIQYLQGRGYTADETYQTRIKLWQSWYSGKVAAFHSYRQYNGRDTIRRTRKTLGMAKHVAEDWANLLLNEKVEITIADETVDKHVKAVLCENKFVSRSNRLLELTFALGTGAFVEYLDGENVKINYISADMIYPLTWDADEIIECAFASIRQEKTRKLIYLNIHTVGENGNYIVENKQFELRGASISSVDLPDNVTEIYDTGSPLPLFQIMRPNIVNNTDLMSPMGISVYANAIDQLEGIDLVYDSYINEFRLGKKRILLPLTMARIEMESTGVVQPTFDANDTEFYAVNMEADKPVEINMELRANAHELALKDVLNLLSTRCGLGTSRYRFEEGSTKTATEVISTKSDLYQNLKKHELMLTDTLTSFINAIAYLTGHRQSVEVTINFDDSIIEDVNAEKTRDLQEARDGIMKKWEYRVKWYGEDEATAKAMVGDELSNDEYMGFGGE